MRSGAMTEPLTPQGKLDLSALPDFHASLLACSGADTVLDMTNVTQLGALCMQSCLAAARAADAAGQKFEIINVSDVVVAQLGCMGFTPETLAKGAL